MTWPMKMACVPLWISLTTVQSKATSASWSSGVPEGLAFHRARAEAVLGVPGGGREHLGQLDVLGSPGS